VLGRNGRGFAFDAIAEEYDLIAECAGARRRGREGIGRPRHQRIRL